MGAIRMRVNRQLFVSTVNYSYFDTYILPNREF